MANITKNVAILTNKQATINKFNNILSTTNFNYFIDKFK